MRLLSRRQPVRNLDIANKLKLSAATTHQALQRLAQTGAAEQTADKRWRKGLTG